MYRLPLSNYIRSLFILFPVLVLATSVQAQGLPDFTELVESNAPAIVNVGTTYSSASPRQQQRGNQELEEFFREFFGDRMPEGMPEQRRRPRSSLGSGFILSADGYVVTNHHVVDGADEITVTLNDQRQYIAEVVGSDARSDLALLKIDASNLPVVALGDSNNLRVGEWVLAIGSPFGLSHSVAAGIISYMGRSLPEQRGLGNYVSYIQTDVAINPGNSGGPLFNLNGEVIGINSQIFSNSGGSIGLSFAIPVDVAKNVIGQLMEKGSVSRGWMGVSISNVDQDLAEAFNLDTPRGALINEVLMGGPAESAGFTSGDVVVAFNGRDIRNSADLPYQVGLATPGSEAEVEIIRDGRSETLRMTVGDLDESAGNRQLGQRQEPEADSLGLRLSELSQEERSEMGISGGLRVEEAEGEIAREAGLRPGDVIISLNNRPLNSLDDFNALVDELPTNRALPVLVLREGRQSFYTIRIPG